MDTKTLNHRHTRRTTLTLEADVADFVEKKLAGDKKLKEKNLINDLLRKGMKTFEAGATKRFSIHGFKTRLRTGVTPERLEEMLDEI